MPDARGDPRSAAETAATHAASEAAALSAQTAATPGAPAAGAAPRPPDPAVAPSALADTTASLVGLRLERDAILLYDGLASLEGDGRRAAAFRHIAANERRHASIWADRLVAAGVEVPPAPGKPRPRIRLILLFARLFGTAAVHELVVALEGDEEEAYAGFESSAEAASIAADEREHAAIWRRLRDGAPLPADHEPAGPGAAPAGPDAAPVGPGAAPAAAPAATPAVPGVEPAPAPTPAGPGGRDMAEAVLQDPARTARAAELAEAGESADEITQAEPWHRASRSGTLRAVIFGVSDGLLSNLSLVMGVAGAGPEQRFVILAGLAGLLAGAFSMGAGEYISMQSQREVFERQIALERAELAAVPDEEEAELAAIYRAKGFTRDEARAVAARMFRNPEAALDALVREELGLDPGELGSPLGAAFGSFSAFAVGAAVPVLPYLVLNGATAFVVSAVASLIGLFTVGALVTLLTGRSALYSGARQVVIGVGAAAVTYLVGRVIGVSVAG